MWKPFSVTVVGASKEIVRLKFKEMTLDRESQLVGVIYGRADSWISWRAGRPDDRSPLRSLSWKSPAIPSRASPPC